MDITILGIESSCDDTSAAVLRGNVLLSNVIASQAVHVKYGGVIPELASRAHQLNIVPVVSQAIDAATRTWMPSPSRGVPDWSARCSWVCRSPRGSRSRATSRWSR